jgi:hypothetical protein
LEHQSQRGPEQSQRFLLEAGHDKQVGLESYDRFFPNQDTMPKGGLGNLIAPPLQKIPRAEGNSVFCRFRIPSAPRSVGISGKPRKNVG